MHQPLTGYVPIGVYDHPPPPDANISSLRLSALPGTNEYLGIKTAVLITKLEQYVRHLLP